MLIPETKRLTLCISTQAGCGFGCAFCATALLRAEAESSGPAEIVDQMLEASRTLAPDAANYQRGLDGNGRTAGQLCANGQGSGDHDRHGWGIGISPRRITLSTVGLVPQIRRLMEETNVNLAISLHAPTDELRGQLMPVNRKYSLSRVNGLLPRAADSAAQAHYLRICVAARRQRFSADARIS